MPESLAFVAVVAILGIVGIVAIVHGRNFRGRFDRLEFSVSDEPSKQPSPDPFKPSK